MDADEPNIKEVMSGRSVASWASIFLDYLDLKAHLLAEESKEAAGHFTGLLVLLGVLLVIALSSALMYGAFLLYLVGLLLRLAWGWSALICAVVLTLASGITFFILGMQLRKPVFQMTLKDLAKDKEWLTQAKTKAP